MSDKKDMSELSFESAMARLEQIVAALEKGSAPLDESLSLFEEGVALVKFCNGKLDSAQQKISVLGNDGSETAFVGGEEK